MSDPQAPPAAAAPKPGDVVIDRLVFDIPGLSVEEAKALATSLGERLSRTGVAGEHARIGVTLGPVGGGQADLAARVAAALMERLV